MADKRSSRKESRSNNEKDPKGATALTKCLKCNKYMENDSQALECNLCTNWTCLKCTGLSAAVYKGMTDDDNENCMYVCRGCLGSLPTLKKISKDVTDIKESTSVRFDELENRMDNIEGNMQTTVSEEVKKLKEDLKSELLHEFDNKIRERDEIDKRADNLILFKVPESESTIPQERISHDQSLIQKVCKQTGVDNAHIIQAIRLGSKKDNVDKCRPLRIRFAIKSQRRSVLMNSKKLSNGDAVVKNIAIARDLTITQRNDYKDKMKAVKETYDTRVSQGETDIIIRGMRIIKVRGTGEDRESEPGTQPPFH